MSQFHEVTRTSRYRPTTPMLRYAKKSNETPSLSSRSAVTRLILYNKLMNPASPTPTTPAATRTPFLPAPLELLGIGGFDGAVGDPGVAPVCDAVALAELLGMPLVASVPMAVVVELEFAELTKADADAISLETTGATSVATRLASPTRRDET